MTIQELNKRIGGKLDVTFSYVRNKDLPYKTIILEEKDMTDEKLRLILTSGYEAVLTLLHNDKGVRRVFEVRDRNK